MSRETSKVSVGLPVFNGEQWVRATIESILSQTFTDFELVISDNCSNDGTADICHDYAKLDDRITFHSNETNIGAALNFQRVFDLSKAGYFKWASANDLIAPDYLSRCVDILDSHPDVAIAASRTQIINANAEVVERCEEDMHLVDDDPFVRFTTFLERVHLNNLEQALMRADLLRCTGGHAVWPGSDTFLVAEMIARGKVYQLPDYLLSRRIAPSATTNLMSDEEIAEFYLPSTTGFPHLQLRKIGALFGIASRLDVPIATRLRFIRYCFRFIYWTRRTLFQEAADYARSQVRRAEAG